MENNCIGKNITNRGYNMVTASGRAVFPLDLKPEDITLNDIGRSLSRICRFNGHLKDSIDHYSVAQHSVIVSYIVPIEHAISGLLHDATEAYVGDMIRPLKASIKQYRDIEQVVWLAVCERFNLDVVMHESIKHADNVMVATERRDLIAENIANWGIVPEPMDDKIFPLSALASYRLFMNRAVELGVKYAASA